MEKSIFEYAKKPALIFAFRFNIFLKTGVFLYFCPPPLDLCSNSSLVGLKLARLAIIADQYSLGNEFADSLTPAFTHTLSCSSLSYWNTVTETHTFTGELSCSLIQTSHPFVWL